MLTAKSMKPDFMLNAYSLDALRCLSAIVVLLIFSIAIAAQVTAPVPFISQPLVPDAASPGGQTFTLVVNGTNFVAGSVVQWNGAARSTEFTSPTRLTATILASDIAANGTASVSVVNPAPGGGVSNVAFFEITTPHTPKFKQSVFETGTEPVGGVAADFNGDGNLDLAIANAGSGTVSILLGNGNGTFQPKTDYTVGNDPMALAFGDFNGDGIPDLAVTNSGSNTVSILLGNGNGTFQPRTDFATGSHPRFVAIGDLNRDGKLDLVIANHGSNTMSVLLGNGDGSFAAKTDYNVGGGPYWISLGDLNGKGNLDIAVLDYDTWKGHGEVCVFLGPGNGTFPSRTFYLTGPYPMSMAMADLNGDGYLDLVTGNWGDGSSTISVLLGNGNGGFLPEMDFASVNEDPFMIGSMDDRADNKLDILLPHYIMLGNGDGTFSKPSSFSPSGVRQVVLAVGDFNNDGKLDVVSGDLDDSSVTVSIQE